MHLKPVLVNVVGDSWKKYWRIVRNYSFKTMRDENQHKTEINVFSHAAD